MLYELNIDNGTLTPEPFADMSHLGLCEKDLENILAKNLLGTLFEDAPLLPFQQERQRQPEADIYALDRYGNVVIFELKRHSASEDAVNQALRYAQHAGRWTAADIDRKFLNYPGRSDGRNIAEAHQLAFGLDAPLPPKDFNCHQSIRIVGAGCDDRLREAVEYWQSQGVDIDFIPYRVYQFNGRTLLEFFAKPFDEHRNPAHQKGVLFDTCASYHSNAVHDMLGRDRPRIAAYGCRKEAVHSLRKGDYVFYSHKGHGLVAAGQILHDAHKTEDNSVTGEDEWYKDVELLTPQPTPDRMIAMSFAEVREVMDRSFFWARIQKRPYLSKEDAEKLLSKLQELLNTK